MPGRGSIHKAGCIITLGAISMGPLCMAQSGQADTLRDGHGRIFYIEGPDASTTSFSYHRSGRLFGKTVELNVDDGRARLDTFWNKDGTLHEAYRISGDAWISTMYDENGILESTTAHDPRYGAGLDLVTLYYPSGVVRERLFVKEAERTFYALDKLDSVRTLYRPDGSVLSEMRYADGELHGAAVDYYPSGAVESIEEFVHDLLMEARYFDAEGRELSNGGFANGNGTLAVHEDGVQVGVCRYKDGRLVKRSCKC